jgi:4-hydroxybenzoate polyprenyltransferase
LYSVKLKQVVLVDILTLAALYTIRIIAGGEAVQVVVSEWLLGFSMFFFLSLACVKRYSELWMLRQSNKQEVRGRGYVAGDLELIGQLGAAAGYLSVLVMALYISSQEVTALYTTPRVLWLLCPMLLYWVSRVWLLAHRGQLHEDPIVFAIRDVTSYGIGVLAALVLYLAI